MQKKRKIIISITISLGLALAATQISNNGGLQSAVISAGLYECRTGTITSLERCSKPLTAERNNVQKEINILSKSIATKKTECIKLEKIKNRTNQAKTCKAQLANLEKNSTTKKQIVSALTLSLSKLVSEIPLQTERAKLQKEIEALKSQLTVKTTECTTFKAQKKTPQTTACNKQVTTLKQSKSVKETALTKNTATLKKIAGEKALTNSPISQITVSIPATPKTVLPTQGLTDTSSTTQIPVLNSAPSTTSEVIPSSPTVTVTTNPTSTTATVTVVTITAPPAVDQKIPAATVPSPVIVTSNTDAKSTPIPKPTVTAPPISKNTSAPVIIDDKYPNVTSPTICQDTTAFNYLSVGDCVGGTQPIYGCRDPMALNQNNNATNDDGSCRYAQNGCKIPGSHNYDENNDTVGDPRLCLTCFDGIQNGDEEKMDCGGSKCQACMMGCTDPNASNHNSAAVIDNGTCIYGIREDYTRPPEVYCKDDKADNNYTGEVIEPDTVNNEVCIYCDLPKKIEEIRSKEGAKVKASLNQLEQEEKDKCMKKICESGSVELSQCTIATEFKPHFALLQMYLVLAGEDPGALDGIYRGSKEITSTPTAASNTRKALVQYAGNTAKLTEIKNECPFVRDLLKNELIKDYEPESPERIRVTQMALTMQGKYSGSIDGNQTTTYNSLQNHYAWNSEKFGVSYIAGPDMKWQVGRATRFGYQDSGDNGSGSPFVDPAGVGISTNNSSIQGASLPLPVTVRMLCPAIKSEIGRLLEHADHGFETPKSVPMDVYKEGVSLCRTMMGSSDPINPSGNGNYSGLGVLSLCIKFAEDAGYTTCRSAHHKARVIVSSIGKDIVLPLVDIGPSEAVWNSQKEATIDLTYSAMKAISKGEAVGTNYETCFQLRP